MHRGTAPPGMLPFAAGRTTREPVDKNDYPRKVARLPGESDGADKERARLERRHTAAISEALNVLLRKVVPAGTTVDNITPDLAVQRYQDNAGPLRDAVLAMLMDAGNLGMEMGMAQVETLMGVRASKPSPYQGINWDLANQHVIDWITGGGGTSGNGYIDYLANALGETSANLIRTHVGQWTQDGTPLQTLVDQLQATVFNSARAELIAQTEITRAYAEANRTAWRESGVIEGMEWRTSNDELVCPVCGPLNGQQTTIDGDFDGLMPPAHPRCRCWVVPAVRLQ